MRFNRIYFILESLCSVVNHSDCTNYVNAWRRLSRDQFPDTYILEIDTCPDIPSAVLNHSRLCSIADRHVSVCESQFLFKILAWLQVLQSDNILNHYSECWFSRLLLRSLPFPAVFLSLRPLLHNMNYKLYNDSNNNHDMSKK